MYDAEIHQVPGVNNEVADVLSRHHTKIDKIFKDERLTKCLSEKQSIELLKRLRMPTNKIFTKEEMAHMLEADSLYAPDDKIKKKKSTAKTGLREVKNNSKTLHNRKNCLGKFRYVPGAKLPSKFSQLKTI